MSEEKNYLEIVVEKIQDQSWIDSQDVKFIENLKHLVEGFQISVRQNTLMVQLFNEYGMAMHSIFDAAMATENDNVSNTNFSDAESAHQPANEHPKAMSGNRAERRAAEKPKRKMPLDIKREKEGIRKPPTLDA